MLKKRDSGDFKKKTSNKGITFVGDIIVLEHYSKH